MRISLWVAALHCLIHLHQIRLRTSSQGIAFLLLQNIQQSNFVQLKSILNSNLNPKSETIEALYFNIKLLNFQERPARRIL